MRATTIRSTTRALALLLATGALGGAAAAQETTRAQQQCLQGFHKQTARVQRALGRNAVGCVRAAGRGRESDALECLDDGLRSSVLRARTRLESEAERRCEDPPAFGVTDAAAAGAALADEASALLARLFGPDLDAALATGKDAARCQGEALRRATRSQDAQWKATVRATKRVLGEGVEDAEGYRDSLLDALGRDRKVARSRAQLGAKIDARCGDRGDLPDLFPGTCAGSDDLAECVDAAAACHFCRSLAAAAELAIDCDLYDDGEPNESCRAVAEALYVAEDGDDDDAGTREEPLATLLRAAQRADAEGFGEIRIAAGRYEADHLPVPDGVSLVGGFDPETFAPGGGESLLEGGATALVVMGHVRPTLVEGLTIRAADATGLGESSYGILVTETTGLTIREVDVQAGRGGAGSDGAAGSAGPGGAAGGRGEPNNAYLGGNGGFGGFSAVGCGGGSLGGNGGFVDAIGPIDGREGSGADPGAGGAACANLFDCIAGDGLAGGSGDPGSDGSVGAGGVLFDAASPLGWIPADGLRGSAGTTGTGGSGGGGGGARDVPFQNWGGSGGGGGGAPGCFGFGGQGGGGGGGSFGVFAYASELAVVDSRIVSDDGGDAGDGGPGGPGGPGGAGGAPGNRRFTGESGAFDNPDVKSGRGGAGGAGGNGGGGGQGGGGGGGVSFAIYAVDSELDESDNVLEAGRGGARGFPGGADGSSGPVGP